MKLNTLDLYYLDQCPKRWKEDPPKAEDMDPTRELMRKVFLMKAIGRDTGWSFDGIASAWDQLYWQGKEITQENMQESVHGILAARQIYKRLPKGDIEIHSTQNLGSFLDAGVELCSSGDFLLSYPNRSETWIYLHSTPKRIRRSPLPAIEHYLVHQKIREAHKKPFYLVIYHSSVKRKGIGYFRVRDDRSLNECRQIVSNLITRAKKNLDFPSLGEHCKDCSIRC